MKFGKKLLRRQLASWAEHYVNYKALKKILKTEMAKGESMSKWSHFQCKFSIHNELKKANNFWKNRVQTLEQALESASRSTPEKIHMLCEETQMLSEFGLLNYLALLKILKKHDKCFPSSKLTPTVVPTVLASHFLQMEPLYKIALRIKELLKGEAEVSNVESDCMTEVQELMNVLSKPLAQRVNSMLEEDANEAGEKDDKGSDGEDEKDEKDKYAPEKVMAKQSAFAMQSAQQMILTQSRVLHDSIGQQKPDELNVNDLMASLRVPREETVQNLGFNLTSTLVGEGSFGRVFLCSGPDELQCAAKVIPLKRVHMQKVVGEVAALLACQGCQYVLDVKHLFYSDQDQSDSSHGSITVISSLCEQELYEVVVEQAPLNEQYSRKLFKQLVAGLMHIHNAGFCHRDIKLENLLLTNGDLKIADFGFAIAWRDEQGMVTPFNRKCGSIAYVAPEAYRGVDYDGRTLDVWSAGVVLFVLVCAAFPFECPDSSKCLYFKSHEGGKTFFPERNLDAELKKLIQSCLRISAIDRPSCAEVFQNEWCQRSSNDIDAGSCNGQSCGLAADIVKHAHEHAITAAPGEGNGATQQPEAPRNGTRMRSNEECKQQCQML